MPPALQWIEESYFFVIFSELDFQCFTVFALMQMEISVWTNNIHNSNKMCIQRHLPCLAFFWKKWGKVWWNNSWGRNAAKKEWKDNDCQFLFFQLHQSLKVVDMLGHPRKMLNLRGRRDQWLSVADNAMSPSGDQLATTCAAQSSG